MIREWISVAFTPHSLFQIFLKFYQIKVKSVDRIFWLPLLHVVPKKLVFEQSQMYLKIFRIFIIISMFKVHHWDKIVDIFSLKVHLRTRMFIWSLIRRDKMKRRLTNWRLWDLGEAVRIPSIVLVLLVLIYLFQPSWQVPPWRQGLSWHRPSIVWQDVRIDPEKKNI